MAIELVTETLTNDDVMMMFGSLLDDLVKIALWPPRVRSKEKISNFVPFLLTLLNKYYARIAAAAAPTA